MQTKGTNASGENFGASPFPQPVSRNPLDDTVQVVLLLPKLAKCLRTVHLPKHRFKCVRNRQLFENAPESRAQECVFFARRPYAEENKQETEEI